MSDSALKLDTLLQLIANPMLLLSLDGTILWFNQATCSLYGWKSSDVIGQSLSEVLDKNQLPSPLPETLTFPCQNVCLMETTETNVKAAQKTIE